MTKKENLFLLIKSLTKAEKRHFKLYAALNKADANYIRLFDVIVKQNVCNEKEIREVFKKEEFVKQLHVTKIYLNKLILKSLRSFYAKFSVEAELHDLLRDIEVLFVKELHNQCRDVVEKVIRLSVKNEKLDFLLTGLKWKRKLLLAQKSLSSTRKELIGMLKIERETLNKLSTETEYWDLTLNIFDIFNNPEKLTELKKHKLFKQVEGSDTLQSKILFYHIRFTYYISLSKKDNAENTLTELIKLLENYPERIKDDPKSYIAAINNKIGLLLDQKRYDEIKLLLEKIRAVPQVYKFNEKSKITVRLIIRTYNIELEMYRDIGDFKKAENLIDNICAYIEKHKVSVPAEYYSMFYYQFAHVYFMLAKYRESLKWVNELLRLSAETREGLLSYGRFLNLIIHFELNNITILRYMVDSCRRFLSKKRNLYDFERVLLNFFSKISTSHKEDFNDLFQKLKKELFAKTEAKVKKHALDYFNFEKWIENKLVRL